ncbi:MAG: GNAT family N-acetyltransferase [Rikenellaceae bacterium]|jgi:RimJ/RimL family protein N-acetyltransferase|nr:GNAT family N-acetyltransferase [Rikenellaceae bacterium]
MKIEPYIFSICPWEIKDASSIAEQANNIRIWNCVRDYFPCPYTLNDAEDFLKMVLSRDRLCEFAIKINGKAVGGIGFIPGTDVERISAEVGYWIGEAYWGRGIVTEALRALVGYVFETTEITRLFAPVFDFNAASMRVLEKAGFSKVGVLHRAAVKNGRVIDLHYYELLKDDDSEE